MQYEIKSRWTGDAQITAEVECDADASTSTKLGLAVLWAVKAKADLIGADLRGADMSRADLRGADMSGADMSGADLRGADMSGANLRGADLRGADMSVADMSGADLIGADMSRAYLRGAYLSGANLSRAKGILRVGPSIDGYEFFAVRRDGVVWIKAGCRWFSGADARAHWSKPRDRADIQAERLRFLDFLEANCPGDMA
jgi:uncharacterized protein YjbI with pentapeptide repeats